jgi:ribosomal protein L32E
MTFQDISSRQEMLELLSRYTPAVDIEVEFVKPSGQTQALLALTTKDIRKIDEDYVLAIRHATGVGEKKRGCKINNKV